MALAYGLLVDGNATPSAAVGTSVGAVLLGALGGALAGGLLAMLARLGPLELRGAGGGARGTDGQVEGVTGPLDSAFVKAAARRAGFHEVGVARAEPLDPAPLDRVLAAGWEADMAWLRTQRAERLDPRAAPPRRAQRGGAGALLPRRRAAADRARTRARWRATPAAATTTRS